MNLRYVQRAPIWIILCHKKMELKMFDSSCACLIVGFSKV